MSERFSRFTHRFTGPTGTRMLMDDLGEVLSGDEVYCNLGGGNPASIPAMQDIFRERMLRAIADGSFDRISGAYDGPQGNKAFLTAICALLSQHYGWPIGPENVAMTAGSQASFFILFNLLSGVCMDGKMRHIKLPLTPEYIGYADIAIEQDAIVSQRPLIEYLDDHLFKYKIDFSQLSLDDSIGAVCVSRPTNPTGNVLGNDEMERLLELTAAAGVPMIIDNAYGVPFPGIVFADVAPSYRAHVIYCMSLSKLGLPGLRTGLVVADAEIIAAIRSLNAILTLATGSLGAILCTDMVASGHILDYANNIIRPYYQARVRHAVELCHRHLSGLDYQLHKPEGAIFLWLWFPRLPISADELYRRLKARHVLVIPGHYFFPGLSADWAHKHECIRISYAQSSDQVEHGITLIAEEVRRAFTHG